MVEETTENIKEQFELVYESKGVKILFNKTPLCFLTKSKNDHLKITSKQSKFYKALKELGKEKLFTIELANTLKNEIDKVFSEIEKGLQPKTREEVKPNTEIKEWIDLAEIINQNLYNREEEFKFIMSCVVSLWFRENDFIFILVVARRGEGKSTILKSFDGSELVYSVDSFSANALAPGTANIGEDRHSLLDESENRNLIVHDMSASLSLPREVKLKVLGEITNSYDEDGLSKFSPGAGNRRYGGVYNFIGGITHRFLQNNWKDISNTGRFLYYKMKELDFEKIIRSELVPNKTELNAAVKGFLQNLNEEYKNLTKDGKKIEFKIYDLGIDMMIDFFKVYEKYLQVVWDKDKKELKYDPLYHVENPTRRYRQALMLLKAMAFLEGKTKINFGDFDRIKQIFWGIDNKGERKKKLELIEEFSDLPSFKGKKWSLFSLYDVETKQEYKKRLEETINFEKEIQIEELDNQTNGLDYEEL